MENYRYITLVGKTDKPSPYDIQVKETSYEKMITAIAHIAFQSGVLQDAFFLASKKGHIPNKRKQLIEAGILDSNGIMSRDTENILSVMIIDNGTRVTNPLKYQNSV